MFVGQLTPADSQISFRQISIDPNICIFIFRNNNNEIYNFLIERNE